MQAPKLSLRTDKVHQSTQALPKYQNLGSIAVREIEIFDDNVEEMKNKRANVTKRNSEVDAEWATMQKTRQAMQKVIQAGQDELDGLGKKIAAKEGIKKALIHLVEALGNDSA